MKDTLSSSNEPEALPTESDIKRWHKKLLESPDLLMKYWTEKRRLSLETVVAAQIGWDIRKACYTLPVRVSGKIVNLTRRFPDGGKSVNLAGRTNKVWFGLGTTKRPGPILVCAGETDALTAYELGYAAVALCSGESSKIDEELLAQLPADREFVVLYDSDASGRDNAPRRAAELFSRGSVRVVDLRVDEVSEGLNDLNDYWAKYQEWEWLNRDDPRISRDELRAVLDAAIEAAEPWVTVETGEVSRRRLHGHSYWLRWARERWRQVGRNKTGYMLARELQSDTYEFEEAWEVLGEFQREVADERQPPYTEGEARGALKRAYARPPSATRGRGTAYRLNDTGHAQRLVDAHGKDFLFAINESSEPQLYVWTGRMWVGSHKSALYDYVSDLGIILDEEADNTESDNMANQLRAQAKALGSMKVISYVINRSMGDQAVRLDNPGMTFDGNKAVFNLRNGVLVLGEDGVSFRQHRREDYCTQIANVDWVEGATAPKWEKFVEHLFPAEAVRKYVQRVLGYCLYGENSEQMLFFLLGASGTGKSQLAIAVSKLLGRYAGPFKLSMLRAKQDEAPRADIVRAMNRRVIFAVESSSQWVLHADEIKRATGGDVESARNPHSSKTHERVVAYTPFIVANQAPRIHGVDRALWRRLAAIPTTKEAVRGEDVVDSFGERLAEEEGSGILRWMAEGWKEYREVGLNPPEAVKKATEYLKEQLSIEDEFLAECCVAEKDAEAKFSDLWSAYKLWCSANDIKTRQDGRLPKNEFGAALKSRGYVDKRKRQPGSETKVSYRVGLRLNGEWDAKVEPAREDS